MKLTQKYGSLNSHEHNVLDGAGVRLDSLCNNNHNVHFSQSQVSIFNF